MRRILFTAIMSWLSLAVSLSQGRKEAAMPVSGNVIVAPVNIDDVRRVLGESSRDVGTLCTSSRVNMWSKYKPVAHTSIDPLTDSGFLATNYGLSVVYGGQCEYTYTPPKGGVSSPYRLSDFKGYRQDIKTGLDFEQTSYSVDIISANSPLTVKMVQDANYIRLPDLYQLFSGCKVRLGVRAYDDTTNYRYYSQYANVNSSVATTWSIPFEELVKFNVGKKAIWVECLSSSGLTMYIMPSTHRYLYITAETGAQFTDPLDDKTLVYNGVEQRELIYYRSGGYSYYVDLNSNRNLMFGMGGLQNNTGVTLSASNMKIRFDYTDVNGIEQIKYVPMYIGTNMGWSAANGATAGGGYFTALGQDIPSFGGKRNVHVGFYVYLLKNGSYKYYRISETVNIRLDKN